MKECRYFWVSGRVQGVFFRASTQQKASLLGLEGWVKNLPDGRVQVLACGDLPALETLGVWLSQGPEQARVSDVSMESLAYEAFEGFQIR